MVRLSFNASSLFKTETLISLHGFLSFVVYNICLLLFQRCYKLSGKKTSLLFWWKRWSDSDNIKCKEYTVNDTRTRNENEWNLVQASDAMYNPGFVTYKTLGGRIKQITLNLHLILTMQIFCINYYSYLRIRFPLR